MNEENNAIIFAFQCRNARLHARPAAQAEALALLHDLSAVPLQGGPFSEQQGMFWLQIPIEQLEKALLRIPRLGYAETVKYVEKLTTEAYEKIREQGGASSITRFHGRWYHVHTVYHETQDTMQANSIEQRMFWLQNPDRTVREVRGYRGDGSLLGKRGLPYYDCRLLVNLVRAGEETTLLDPFAGAGGIVREAVASGYNVYSTDIDPVLAYGLQRLGSHHSRADARVVPFTDETFHGIATEVPFACEATQVVIEALEECYRVLQHNGRIALMCAEALGECHRVLQYSGRIALMCAEALGECHRVLQYSGRIALMCAEALGECHRVLQYSGRIALMCAEALGECHRVLQYSGRIALMCAEALGECHRVLQYSGRIALMCAEALGECHRVLQYSGRIALMCAEALGECHRVLQYSGRIALMCAEALGECHRVLQYSGRIALMCAEALGECHRVLQYSGRIALMCAEALGECHRVLQYSGRIALMCAEAQAIDIREKALTLKLINFLDTELDRKGTPVHVFAWQKL